MIALKALPVSLALMLGVSFTSMRAQMQSAPRVDLAVSYVAQRSLKATTDQNFWMYGGSLQLGADVWKGWGVAADVTGSHASSIGASGVPLSLVTATFGPRYRWHATHKLSVYGEALVGEANGFHSLFPAASGAQTDANGLALQLGGGLDCRLGSHYALRLLDAGWLRTQLPNGTDNVQNSLRLGAGVVVRFGRR